MTFEESGHVPPDKIEGVRTFSNPERNPEIPREISERERIIVQENQSPTGVQEIETVIQNNLPYLMGESMQHERENRLAESLFQLKGNINPLIVKGCTPYPGASFYELGNHILPNINAYDSSLFGEVLRHQTGVTPRPSPQINNSVIGLDIHPGNSIPKEGSVPTEGRNIEEKIIVTGKKPSNLYLGIRIKERNLSLRSSGRLLQVKTQGQKVPGSENIRVVFETPYIQRLRDVSGHCRALPRRTRAGPCFPKDAQRNEVQ